MAIRSEDSFGKFYAFAGKDSKRLVDMPVALTLPMIAMTMMIYTSASWAQDYPNKPIRVVTAGIGSSSDFALRLITQGLAGTLSQPMTVENRGGGGIVAAPLVSKAPADGYTLLFHGSTIWLTPLLQQDVPYDPVRDLAPITWATMAPTILAVNPALPVKSVKDLIALAKQRPGELNYSSGAVGGSSFLAPELFKSMAGVRLTRIPYKDDTQEMADLIAGRVQLTFGGMGSIIPHMESGKLRALAVSSSRRSPAVPKLPTVAESGLPGYESVSILGFWAPGGTPSDIINLLNEEIVRVLNRPSVKEKLLTTGVEPVGNSPKQFADKIASEISKWSKVFKDAGIKAN